MSGKYKEFMKGITDNVVQANLANKLKQIIQEKDESEEHESALIDGEFGDLWITTDPDNTIVWHKYSVHPDLPELFELSQSLTDEVGIPLFVAKLAEIEEYK